MPRKYVTLILSSTGLTPTSTDFSIYANNNNYVYPIANNITNHQLTATTTPFNILVDSTATRMMVLDKNNGKKTYADITTNNLCDTCNLGFDYYPTATVGRLYAGNLTGSCQSSFGDYRINWYGPNSSTNIAYASGSGSSFNYNFTHPLTGPTGLFALAGTYFPVIDKVKIGGVAFSQSGDTLYSNDPVPALLTCFESVTVQVDAFKCDNGDSSNLPQYEHRVKFTAVGNGDLPRPLNSTFLLSAGTKYFPWKFQGETIPDKLKLTYYGSAYNYTPIVLEYWEVGSAISSNDFNITTFPKSASTSGYFGKITSLTGFTINANDTIIMDVIPNQNNPATNWDFYFGCEDSIDCSYVPTTQRLKISGSTITAETPYAGCYVYISFKYSGLTYNELHNIPLKDYAGNYYVNYVPDNNGIGSVRSTEMFHTQNYCDANYRNQFTIACASSGAYVIKYEKSSGLFKITSNDLSYIESVHNHYNSYVKPYVSSYSADSTNMAYYRDFQIVYPNSTGSSVCGDGTGTKYLTLHQSSIVSTGQTGLDYYIQYTMPTISYGISLGACDLYCNGNYSTVVSEVNNYATGVTHNYTGTTNTASRYTNPHRYIFYVTSGSTSRTDDYETLSRELTYTSLKTVPASGSSNTIIPYLSATTCQSFINDWTEGSNGYGYVDGNYKMELTNPLDIKDFKIYVNTTVETLHTTSPVNYLMIYNISGGTVHYSDPNYII